MPLAATYTCGCTLHGSRHELVATTDLNSLITSSAKPDHHHLGAAEHDDDRYVRALIIRAEFVERRGDS